jgi:hypothetical protein
MFLRKKPLTVDETIIKAETRALLSPTQQLDETLLYISAHQNCKAHEILRDVLRMNRNYPLNGILQKLIQDNYIIKHPKSNQKEDFDTYEISFDGLLFLSRKGYRKRNRIEAIKHIWIIAKIIANMLNAVMILVIGALSVYVVNKSNEDKTENKVLKTRVDSLLEASKTKEIIINRYKNQH